MKTINALFILLAVLLLGCESAEKFVILDIDNALGNKHLGKLSDYSTSISYIPLETTEESLINEGAINYLDKIGNYIIIADMKNCVLFDSSGKFVRTIGRQGTGPGEYPSIRRVVVDKESQLIYISHNGLGILEYDIEGTYRQTILPKNRLGAWTFIDDNVISDLPNYRGNNPYMLAIINRSGDTLSKMPNYDLFKLQGQPIMFTNDPFFEYNKSLKYYRLFNDTVYTFQPEESILEPRFIFQSTAHALRDELRFDGSKFVSTNDDYIIPWKITETNNSVYVSALRNKKGLVYFMYNKKDKSFCHLTNSDESIRGIYNDIDYGLPFYPEYRIDDNLACMVLTANAIIEHLESNKECNQTVFSNITDDSNPVIAFFTLK